MAVAAVLVEGAVALGWVVGEVVEAVGVKAAEAAGLLVVAVP